MTTNNLLHLNDLTLGSTLKQMSLKLTKEQVEKLKKLDIEMKQRADREKQERAKHTLTSSSTGIPLDIAGLDVIKIGTLFGLIKKKDVFEGNEKGTTRSLLKILLGDDENTPPMCPEGYHQPPLLIKEEEKIAYHKQFVQNQCLQFSKLVSETIDTELLTINKHITVNLHDKTLDCFKTTITETVETLLDLIEENPEDPELWESLTITRNALLGVLNVCEYKKLVKDNILHILGRVPRSQTKISQHLSFVDRRLSLFNGSVRLTQPKTFLKTYNEQELETKRLLTELEIRVFTNPPELKAFVFEEVAKQICVPSLMYLPIETVVEKCLVGPFRNNPIGFLFDSQTTNVGTGQLSPVLGDFYILKSINPDGGRVWVVDSALERFSEKITNVMTAYLITIFRTLYKACFDDNLFFVKKTHNNPCKLGSVAAVTLRQHKPSKQKKHNQRPNDNKTSTQPEQETNDTTRHPRLVAGCPQQDPFRVLIRNIAVVSDGKNFYKLLTLVLKTKSPLFPTDYDFFNFIKSRYDQRPPFIPIFESADKTFQTNLTLMFDDAYDQQKVCDQIIKKSNVFENIKTSLLTFLETGKP